MRKCILAITAASIFASSLPIHAKPASRPLLTLSAAEHGAKACQAFAEEHGLKVAISVLDRSGRLVLFKRMDDVYQKQAELSQVKAETAATTPLSTKNLGEAVTRPGTGLIALENLPGISLVEGGEPIKLSDGYSVGGVGVSGASPQQDGSCASVAAAAIARSLTDV